VDTQIILPEEEAYVEDMRDLCFLNDGHSYWGLSSYGTLQSAIWTATFL
jgi:hypothetical protein